MENCQGLSLGRRDIEPWREAGRSRLVAGAATAGGSRERQGSCTGLGYFVGFVDKRGILGLVEGGRRRIGEGWPDEAVWETRPGESSPGECLGGGEPHGCKGEQGSSGSRRPSGVLCQVCTGSCRRHGGWPAVGLRHGRSAGAREATASQTGGSRRTGCYRHPDRRPRPRS